MSISTDLEIQHIKQLKELTIREQELLAKLDFIQDEITHLKSVMSKEDIEKAYNQLEREYNQEQ